jgi:superfamily II DNA or RNA helicase
MTLDRQWLRGFVQLGARADADGIPATDVQRQEDTVLRACELLGKQPGVVLADEVGMGKTFEALGVAAAFHHRKSKSRIVVLTPGPDLNTKWVKEFRKFPYDFGNGSDAVTDARTLRDFLRAVNSRPVTIAPVSMFQSGRGASEQVYLLSLYCYWKGLHGNTANALVTRALGPDAYRVDVDDRRFLDTFELREIESTLARAFKKLDDVYETEGLAGFENKRRVRRLLTIARSAIASRMLPIVDLLIVDEAHKLKNPSSLRSEALRTVFRKRFRKALFLTATPFQLDIHELKEVFAVFAQARQAPSDLMDDIEKLLSHIRDYQSQYEDFQQTWCSLEPEFAKQFRAAYDRSCKDVEQLDDPNSKIVLAKIDRLIELKKSHIEPGFQQWMIRSLRDGKRDYRKHNKQKLPAKGTGCLPFLIYERFIAELFRRQHQTHKAAAEINMVSSYAAASKGAVISDRDGIPEQADAYRKLLRTLLNQFRSGAGGDHPKLSKVVADAIEAGGRGEKTLIFCSRIATLRELAVELDREWTSQILHRWKLVFPKAKEEDIFGDHTDDNDRKGIHENLQNRLHRTQDALYLVLREPYLYTVEPLAHWALGHLDEIIESANGLLSTLWVGKTAAERIDYQLAKRCVEQATASHWRDAHAKQPVSDGMHRLCAPEFLTLGLDHHSDEHEADTQGDFHPQWSITDRLARRVIGQPDSLWEGLTPELNKLSWVLRVGVVEQLSRYLAFRQVPFIVDLLAEAQRAGLSVQAVKSDELLHFMPQYWKSATGVKWQSQLRDFLRYFLSRSDDADEDSGDESRESEQESILNGLRGQKEIKFARHTEDIRSREKLRVEFNTPLFPMVLVANEVMQEGLDLHKHCRRIVHHDLEWNPAKIEQRVGRIDRLGSLTSRLREIDSTAMLDILYPVIGGTIDERLYRTVKSREKWLEFLLGAPPDFANYAIDDTEPPPLPARLAAELAIVLSPTDVN